MATLLVVTRGLAGEPHSPRQLAERLPFPAQVEPVLMPAVELSSTEIRRRASEGRSIRYQTPRAVEQYLLHAGLYRQIAPTSD